MDSRFILVCYFLWELYIFLHLLQQSTSARPPSPPRGLSSVLRSPVLTNDLRSFLADLDEEAGEAEERTRVNWLNFALACKEVAEEQGGEEGASRKLLSKMHKVHMSFGSAAGGRVGNPNGGGGDHRSVQAVLRVAAATATVVDMLVLLLLQLQLLISLTLFFVEPQNGLVVTCTFTLPLYNVCYSRQNFFVTSYPPRLFQDYFRGENRVSLSSSATWSACQRLCSEASSDQSSSDKKRRRRGKKAQKNPPLDLTPLWKAHDDVLSKLDDLHQAFLLGRTDKGGAGIRTALPDVIQQCLL